MLHGEAILAAFSGLLSHKQKHHCGKHRNTCLGFCRAEAGNPRAVGVRNAGQAHLSLEDAVS